MLLCIKCQKIELMFSVLTMLCTLGVTSFKYGMKLICWKIIVNSEKEFEKANKKKKEKHNDEKFFSKCQMRKTKNISKNFLIKVNKFQTSEILLVFVTFFKQTPNVFYHLVRKNSFLLRTKASDLFQTFTSNAKLCKIVKDMQSR